MGVIDELEQMHINDIIKIARDSEDVRSRAAYTIIIERYKGVIKKIIKSRNYYMPGSTYEDLLQEGMYGIYKSIKDFKEDVGDYEVFLRVCVKRQLISAVKTSTRKKHTPLNQSLHLDKNLPENDNLSMMDLLAAKKEVQYNMDFEFLNPEEKLMLKEEEEMKLQELYSSMSEKETKVYDLYKEGIPYKDIKERLNEKNPKMIDNAVQRFKRKIDKIKSSEMYNDWDERTP